ncbi:hypothetical protein CP532_1065 [Ophiocordyceps camponoti-leonardi (nom. inval.)]|nr:hypothetical protein CP532_1065 [Ophiocordyceps camponoti-leonardi (nom. inval.)]
MKFSSIRSLSLLVAGSLPLLGWAAEPVEEAPSWTLKQVTRIIPNEREVWLGFLIASEGYDPRWCYLLAHVDSPAKEASFVDSPCVGGGFSVSWGYKKEEDAGIMSLSNDKKTRIAWFGWNDINKSTVLADNGPNNTEMMGMLVDNTQTPTETDGIQTPTEADDHEIAVQDDNAQTPAHDDSAQTPAQDDNTQTPTEEDDNVIVQQVDGDTKPTNEEVANIQAGQEGPVDTMEKQEGADDKKPVAFVA